MIFPKTILITGASRGIGKALVCHYLQTRRCTVIAGLRDVDETEAAQALLQLEVVGGSKLILLQLDNNKPEDIINAIEWLQDEHDIKQIDTVLAVAGGATVFDRVDQATVEDLHDHFQVNAIATVKLYQATKTLLEAAPGPQFFAFTSILGSIAEQGKGEPSLSYGMSKAALNYFVRKLAFENEGLTAAVIHPGWVNTAMGRAAAAGWGLDMEPPVPLEKSVKGLIKLLDNATRASTSGKFLDYTGEVHQW